MSVTQTMATKQHQKASIKPWLIGIGLFIAGYLAFCAGYVYHEKFVSVSSDQVVQQASSSEKVLNLVNQERAKVGVAPLVSDPTMNEIAKMKYEDMVANKYDAHDNPKTGKNIVWDNPYWQNCISESENLTGGFSEQDAVARWSASPAHRAAMLNANYTKTGVYIAPAMDGYTGVSAVQLFCQVK